MIVEQFLKDIQKLIDRGTINPSAKIGVEGEVNIYNDACECIVNVEFDNLEIGIHESCYNKLILIVK